MDERIELLLGTVGEAMTKPVVVVPEEMSRVGISEPSMTGRSTGSSISSPNHPIGIVTRDDVIQAIVLRTMTTAQRLRGSQMARD